MCFTMHTHIQLVFDLIFLLFSQTWDDQPVLGGARGFWSASGESVPVGGGRWKFGGAMRWRVQLAVAKDVSKFLVGLLVIGLE